MYAGRTTHTALHTAQHAHHCQQAYQHTIHTSCTPRPHSTPLSATAGVLEQVDTVLRYSEEAELRCAALRLVGTLMLVGGISRGCTPLEPSQGLVMLEEEVGELQVRG